MIHLLHQLFPEICFNYPHIDFASVDFVMTHVILATLKTLIWLDFAWISAYLMQNIHTVAALAKWQSLWRFSSQTPGQQYHPTSPTDRDPLSVHKCLLKIITRNTFKQTALGWHSYASRRWRTNFGDRAFSAAGPRVWNYLPTDLRHRTCHTAVSGSHWRHFYFVCRTEVQCESPIWLCFRNPLIITIHFGNANGSHGWIGFGFPEVLCSIQSGIKWNQKKMPLYKMASALTTMTARHCRRLDISYWSMSMHKFA